MNIGRFTPNPDQIILYILAGLSFCVVFGLSAPALMMNDEWITVNQLNQLATGSQLIENEGKYGSNLSHEQTEYFATRGNYLGYSIFLPLISIFAMKLILISKESFRFLFLMIWFVVTISALLAGIWLTKQYNKKISHYVFWAILLLFFGLFLLNLYYYQPFYFSIEKDPIESAAVIFTNEVLFALMAPLIYSLFRNLSLDRRSALLSTMAVICCSTYFFWSTTAKDHLLVAFLLTVLFWLFSRILLNENKTKWFSFYAVSGLLCWARPEFGIFILVGLIIWNFFLYVSPKIKFINFLDFGWKEKTIFSALGLLTGLTPFFVNNYIITGNMFVPPQYYIYSSKLRLTSVISSMDTVQNDIFSRFFLYFGQIIKFFKPNIHDILVDIPGLVLSPSNGGAGILYICPIILPALLFGLIHRKDFFQLYSPKTREMMKFSVIVIILAFIALSRAIYGSTISIGSLPDMRYFSPLYLPLGIISMLLFSPLIMKKSDQYLKYLTISVFICAPILVIGTTFALPYGFTNFMCTNFFLKILIFLFLLIFGLSALDKKFWTRRRVFPLLFSYLIMIPVAFQFFLVVFYSNIKMNGYGFWLPILEYLFTYVIQIIS
mgnify:CR=1 FL=1